MVKIPVQTTEGTKYEDVYNVYEFEPHFDFDILSIKKRKMNYCTAFGTFDIETTTIEPPIVKYQNRKPVYQYTPYGYMYHWQFCINDIVIFGRTWNEYLLLLKKLHEYFKLYKNRSFVIYVHNLAYEFQFMKDFLQIESVFAREKRKPMKVTTFDGFEFRCSYYLSNMSLAKFGENYGTIYYKKTDQYDYRKLRTPVTPLTELEQDYCYCDVRGLHEAVTNLMAITGYHIANVPLTSTAFVRNEVRKNVLSNKSNRYRLKHCRFDLSIYDMLHRMFRGGDTHGNRYYIGKILSDVNTVDRASSYPHVQMVEKYPFGKWLDYTNKVKKDFRYFKAYIYKQPTENGGMESPFDKSVIMHIALHNPHIKKVPCPYIDVSHVLRFIRGENYDQSFDNGRILSIENGWIELYLTDIDYQIIEREYEFDDIRIFKFYVCRRDYLPKEFRQSILEYYEAKTKLKNVPGKEYEYMKGKNKLNGIFGMGVTDILPDEVLFRQEVRREQWKMLSETMTKEKWEDYRRERFDKIWNSYNLFQLYSWGIWVTAYARYALHEMIWELGITDHIYNDTDSCKFLNIEDHYKAIDRINRKIIEKNLKMDVPPYVTHNGETYHMGVWEYEQAYDHFITYGAKKYAYDQNEIFHITVSGMNKEKGAKAIGNIHNFKLGKTFRDVGRTTSWFNDDCIHTITIDGCKILTASNIGILDTTYTLTITPEMSNMIENLGGIEDEHDTGTT